MLKLNTLLLRRAMQYDVMCETKKITICNSKRVMLFYFAKRLREVAEEESDILLVKVAPSVIL